jgi:two-component system chemotaxis response regulator CheY
VSNVRVVVKWRKKMATVVIVDDAKFMRKTLTSILQNAHYEVIGEAENGEEAVALYRALQPDLMTMDITMPLMSGIEAVKKIKEEFPDAKIVMCSAIGQQRIVVEAIEAGAKDFIVKPFDEIRVLDAIKRVLG